MAGKTSILTIIFAGAVCVASSANAKQQRNMIDGYGISNRNTLAKSVFPTEYSQIAPNAEYFDVYSEPIETRYGKYNNIL